jgi:uncharacterized membrane protein
LPPGASNRCAAGTCWCRRRFFGARVVRARTLLIGITGSVITIIALVLGLTLVGLQVSSTQYSPRVLRNFLRDRVNQVCLSAIVATFAYSAAGLYTVVAAPGSQPGGSYPQLAVTVAIVLSPAVNDPYTAIQAIHGLTVLLGALASRRWATTRSPARTRRASSCMPPVSPTTPNSHAA